jgi:hypothetical protein
VKNSSIPSLIDFDSNQLEIDFKRLKEESLRGISYWCLNRNCFYDGTRLKIDDLVPSQFYNSALDIMDIRFKCPSCNEPVWGEKEDGYPTQ